MELYLGHPARWLDYARACDEVEERLFCRVEARVTTWFAPGQPVRVSVLVRAVPRWACDLRFRNGVEHEVFGWVDRSFAAPDLFYRGLWYVEQVASVVWPGDSSWPGKAAPAYPGTIEG